MTNEAVFAQPDDGEWIDLGGGNRRKVILQTPELMQVAFRFDKGGIGAPHSHPHVQASYVAEGRFEVTINGVTETIGKGGSFIVPSGLTHSVVALEAGLLVDSFTPRREDFL
jgi:quercetin dioxygenase-like cupin family protein